MTSRALLVFAAVALVGGPASLLAQGRNRALAPNGGTQWLYMGTYAGDIQIFDEATEARVGQITLQTGIPRSLVLSQDRTRFYALDWTLERVEIVDIAARTTIDTFTLSEGATKSRISRLQVDPLNRFVVLLVRPATKQIDRWEIGDLTLQVYDLRQKKVTRTIPWPRGEEREFVDLRFSPDGKLFYIFGEDVAILETENFTEVDTWALSRPVEAGLGPIDFGSVDDVNDDPGFFTGIFVTTDPVQHRRLMGLGRVDLAGKRIEFTPIGPAQRLAFAVAPDRHRGYGLLQDIGRFEFWTFDLDRKALVSRQEFSGRPRMDLRVSSNGRLIYIYQAGATIDVHDASTFKYLRTLQMEADQTTDLFVLPAPARGTPGAP